MKKQKTMGCGWLLMMLAVFLILGVTGSAKENKGTVDVQELEIISPTRLIAPGGKVSIKTEVYPEFATDKSVTWSSSNEKYAVVSKDGVVTAKAAGRGKKVTIRAKAKDGSGVTAFYEFYVLRGGVKRIRLSGSRSVRAGRSVQVKAVITASKGANKRLYWTTSNRRYATVSTKGLVRTKRAGKGRTVTITARATDGSGKRASIAIRIR